MSRLLEQIRRERGLALPGRGHRQRQAQEWHLIAPSQHLLHNVPKQEGQKAGGRGGGGYNRVVGCMRRGGTNNARMGHKNCSLIAHSCVIKKIVKKDIPIYIRGVPVGIIRGLPVCIWEFGPKNCIWGLPVCKRFLSSYGD
jgi:hypothetical protein